jgi:peroxiredoxin
MTFSEQLTKIQQNIKGTIPRDRSLALDRETERITKSGILQQCLQVGDRAPDFSLLNTNGERIKLHALLAKGMTIVSFYRGNWCPYCGLELKALEAIYPTIQMLNTSIVAISPQSRKYSLSTRAKNNLSFPVLSDPNNHVAHQFGIVHQVPKSVWQIYQELNADFTKSNENLMLELPLPATFIVGQNGAIAYSFVDSDYTQRLDPIEIISFLKQLNSHSEESV